MCLRFGVICLGNALLFLLGIGWPHGIVPCVMLCDVESSCHASSARSCQRGSSGFAVGQLDRGHQGEQGRDGSRVQSHLEITDLLSDVREEDDGGEVRRQGGQPHVQRHIRLHPFSCGHTPEDVAGTAKFDSKRQVAGSLIFSGSDSRPHPLHCRMRGGWRLAQWCGS